MELPKLFKKTATGATQEWQIFYDKGYYTVSGQTDGKKVISATTRCPGKNIGKKNETTPEQQSELEARAKWQKKKDEGYVEDVDSLDGANPLRLDPMLAKDYADYTDKIVFPVYSQPKLDGCIAGDTLVRTNKGDLQISDIVKNRLKVEVLSYNTNTKKVEYKPILNYAEDGVDINEQTTQWFEITFDNGETLKLTGNHRVWLPKLVCWRRVDELCEEDFVLVNTN
jgi:hypothetical protein